MIATSAGYAKTVIVSGSRFLAIGKGGWKTMKIEITGEDFGTLCICALRYCHGIRTYMPSVVQGIVKRHFKELSDLDIGVILEDKEFQTRFDLWGDDCDKADWEKFYADLKEYKEGK